MTIGISEQLPAPSRPHNSQKRETQLFPRATPRPQPGQTRPSSAAVARSSTSLTYSKLRQSGLFFFFAPNVHYTVHLLPFIPSLVSSHPSIQSEHLGHFLDCHQLLISSLHSKVKQFRHQIRSPLPLHCPGATLGLPDKEGPKNNPLLAPEPPT